MLKNSNMLVMLKVQRLGTMKMLAISVGVLIANLTFGQLDFSKVPISTDTTYGYVNWNPVKLKKGNQGKSVGHSIAYLKSLKTDDNQELELLFRRTVDDPGYSNSGITNRSNGMPINGKLGLLDAYHFVTSETRDTVIIYVDIYNKGDLKIPTGLKSRNE